MSSRRPLLPRSRRRGSVLIVALIFSLVIAISLGSFLQISTTASRLSYRTFYQGVAMNIAESGLEQALWEINKDSGGWTGWESVSSNTYRKSFTLDDVAGGAKTTVKVYAKSGSGAYVIARAIVTPPTGAPIEKWIKVTLSKKSRFSVGGLGKHGIVANGNNVVMASWNSDPDKDASTAYVAFDESVKRDKAPLATLFIDASLNSGQADVNGTAAVGGSSLDLIKVGTQGYIGPFNTAPGVKDPDSVSTNFSTDLEPQEAPTQTRTALGAITSNLALPVDPAGDNKETVNGVTTYYYSASEISIGTNETLSITPGYNVVIVVTGDISVGGGDGAINIGGTRTTNTETHDVTYVAASLKLYTDGDVDIGGKGSANEVTLQTETPGVTSTPTAATTTTVRTTISGVRELKNTGNPKTVIGWQYDKEITTTVTVGSTSTSSTQTFRNLESMISNSGVMPVAGTTSTSDTVPAGSPVTSPSVFNVVGTEAGQPNNFWLIGTRTDAATTTRGPQSFKISGNGNLSAVVDAPNAKIEAKGGGNGGYIYGSLIGYELKFTGNDCFYYDESLANLDNNSRLGIDNWDELVSEGDRTSKVTNASSTTYASLMNF